MASEGGDLKWWPLLDKVRESCALNGERRCWRLQVAPACPSSSRDHAGPRRAVSAAPGATLAPDELLKHPSCAHQRASTSFSADQLVTPHSGSGWPFPGPQYLYQGPLASWS